MTRREAHGLVLRYLGTRPRTIRGWITEYYPSTPGLRRALRDRTLPREARRYVYAWLLYRRHRSRERRRRG